MREKDVVIMVNTARVWGELEGSYARILNCIKCMETSKYMRLSVVFTKIKIKKLSEITLTICREGG